MTKQAKKALFASIEHWHQNLDMLILNHLSDQELTIDISTDSMDCALCNEFYYNSEWDNCEDCPIYKKVNVSYCNNTPYNNVFWWKINEGNYGEGYEVITAELNFLYSLLED